MREALVVLHFALPGYIIIKTFVRFLMAHTTHWNTHLHIWRRHRTHTHAGRPEIAVNLVSAISGLPACVCVCVCVLCRLHICTCVFQCVVCAIKNLTKVLIIIMTKVLIMCALCCFISIQILQL